MTSSDAANTVPGDLSPDARPGRERILEHARALFLERGYVDVSMREIAEAAGLRKATIYHHFADKEELFTAIVMAEVTASRERMEECITGLTTLPERLEELAYTHFANARSNAWRLAQDFREHIPEERHGEMHKELGGLFAIYRQVFEEAQAAGEIAGFDAVFAASGFFQTILAWTWQFPYPFGAQEMGPRELAQTAVHMVLYGVAGPKLRGDTGKASNVQATAGPGVETPG
jgi:AcrR family transcriptional regulator